MTSFAPSEVIACPHCEQLALRQYVRTLRIAGVTRWSDGDMSCFPKSTSFTRCSSCNNVYWLEDAKTVGTMPEYRNEPRLSPWQRLLNRLRGTTPDSNRVAIPDDWYWARPVESPDIDAFIVGIEILPANETPEREQRLRRLLWWRFNDHRRVTGRTNSGISATIRDAHERSNLLRLLELSRNNDSTTSIERVEILRELGRFDEARDALSSVKPETDGVAVLAAKIEARDEKVCVISQEPW